MPIVLGICNLLILFFFCIGKKMNHSVLSALDFIQAYIMTLHVQIRALYIYGHVAIVLCINWISTLNELIIKIQSNDF